MNNSIFAWIKDVNTNGTLPTATCELIVSGDVVIKAITSVDVVHHCKCYPCLAQIHVCEDSMGHAVVRSLKPIPIDLVEVDYLRWTALLKSGKEQLVGRFFKLLSMITVQELAPFKDFILSKPDILEKFMLSKASYQHHHSVEHGLFEHSVEVAEITYYNAKHLRHSELECQTGLVAGLFHDIGKIYPMLISGKNQYTAGPHESYSFSILANPLGQLGTYNSKVFSLLAALLSAKPYGYQPRYALEYILKQADRCSAESNYARMNFRTLPDHYDFTKVDGKTICRLIEQT